MMTANFLLHFNVVFNIHRSSMAVFLQYIVIHFILFPSKNRFKMSSLIKFRNMCNFFTLVRILFITFLHKSHLTLPIFGDKISKQNMFQDKNNNDICNNIVIYGTQYNAFISRISASHHP